MSNYKRGAYTKTHQGFCLWCGKEIQTKKGGKFCTDTSTCRTLFCRANKTKSNTKQPKVLPKNVDNTFKICYNMGTKTKKELKKC